MRSILLSLALAALASGCATTPVPRSAPSSSSSGASPLGNSYVLIPLPSDDDGVLGRVLSQPLEPGRSLEEVSAPNPCADKLGPAKTTPTANTFEDAEELSIDAKASAQLGVYGFSGDAGKATHFVYKLSTAKRTARTDTTEYLECCRAKGCGYGFVSALIYGDGEYATAEESRAKVGGSIGLAAVGGEANLKILHKRTVHGWLAALVTVTDASKKAQLGPLGVAAAAGITETGMPEQVKQLYELDKLHIVGVGEQYEFQDGRGTAVKENEFVRRYRNATGSNELDDVERRRNDGRVIGAGTVFAIGAVAAVGSAAAIGGQNNPQATGKLLPVTIAGAVVGVGGGVWLGVELFGRYDGTDTSHALTDRDARLYVERYNRALLRKTIKEVQRSQSVGWDTSVSHKSAGTFHLTPYVAPTGAGLRGSF